MFARIIYSSVAQIIFLAILISVTYIYLRE